MFRIVKMTNQRQNLYRLFYFIVILTLIALTFTIIPYIEAIHEGRKIGFRSIAVSNFVRFYLWGALFPLIFGITRKFGFESNYYLRNFRLVDEAEKNLLLNKYWAIPVRQVETSIVLVDKNYKKSKDF